MYIYIYIYVCVCVCVCIKQRNVYFYDMAAYQNVISWIIEGTIRYQIQKAHKLPPISLQSVPIHRTCNMSLVMFHIKICYNINSDTTAVLVC